MLSINFLNKFVAAAVILIFISSLSNAQTLTHTLDDVVLTAGRYPITFSDVTRTISLLDKKQLEAIPANNVQDVLNYVPGIDLRTRGVFGVQSDIIIRGGTFEQTLIMIDGIKVSDPQTGHHNLNLPVTLQNIQRIEVLKGQGSTMFGPNAFSGIVNIITNKERVNSLNISLTGGENSYYDAAVSGSYATGILNHKISFSKMKTDGYRYNTAFDAYNFTYSPQLLVGNGVVNLFVGYNKKDFGANSFYTTRFPDQAEETETRFVNASAEFGNNKLTFSPKLYWRRNDDVFVLNRFNHAFYRNEHRTNIYGGELSSAIKTDVGKVAIGGEFTQEEIESNNLGEHTRNKGGVFGEITTDIAENLSIKVGGFIYNYSDIGWKIFPGFDAGYKLNNNLRVYGSVGKAFRIPTFTELFYSDPATVGNPDLKHEETLNFELGMKGEFKRISATVSLFRKQQKNLIDWELRDADEGKWYARNITDVNTNGFEGSVNFDLRNAVDLLPINFVSLSYTYLSSNKESDDIISRYLLQYLRHQAIININHDVVYGINTSWLIRYENRINSDDHFLTDIIVKKQLSMVELFVKANNLFNTSNTDIVGIELPGRWIFGGVKLNLK